jgi:hypothetical protein
VKVEMARKSEGSTESVSFYAFSRDPILQQLTISQAQRSAPKCAYMYDRLTGNARDLRTGDRDRNQRHAANCIWVDETNTLVTITDD